MTPFLFRHCATPAQRQGPYDAWKNLYATINRNPTNTPASISRQWLWLLQKGSAVAAPSHEDQSRLAIDQSPLITGGGYLRTSANAYLTKQLDHVESLLKIQNSLVSVVPHAGVQILKKLYKDAVLVVPDTRIGTMHNAILAAARADKVIWVTLRSPASSDDIQFMSILKKLPYLDKKKYKLIWSFNQISNAGPLPLTVICGKKHLLWNHPQLLSQSGYCPDKASVDMLVIKLTLALSKNRSLNAVLPGNKVSNTPARQLSAEKPQSVDPTGEVLSKSIYQQLGDLWQQHFTNITTTLRDDLRNNTEINTLIDTMRIALGDAETQLASPHMKDQYRAIRAMADTLLVAETLKDTDSLQPADFAHFSRLPDNVYISNYGMTALTSAIIGYKQLSPSHSPKIATMAHTYFETTCILNTINSIQPHFCIHHAGVLNIADIPPDTDILVIEPHPNNVTEKSPVTPPSLKKLAKHLRAITEARDSPLLVVMDITIGVISDPKLDQFITTVSDLIDAQKLHIVMGQSLVKFGAMGIDVASAGLSLVWSQNTVYKRDVSELLVEATPPAHVQAFYKFMLTTGLPLATEYLDTIRNNTQRLSDGILSDLAMINMKNRDIRVMDIHPNLDRGTCYVGLDFDVLTTQFTDGTSAEKIAEMVLKTLQKIATDDEMIMTSRSSFGFPFCNATVCGSAIRVTVGIESETEIKQMSEIISLLVAGIKWQAPYETAPELTAALRLISNIARDTRVGFSRELRSIEEVCCGEYETEDGFEPDFNWEETGTGTLSWKPGKDHFGWQIESHASREIPYLEIDTAYSVNTSSRIQRAIALLSIENAHALYDERSLQGQIPKDMQRFSYDVFFGDHDHAHQIWSKDPLDVDPVIRSIKVKKGTRLDSLYFPAEKVLIYYENTWWKQSEMEGSPLEKWKTQLQDGQYICHIKQTRETLKLKLTPRQNKETWVVDNTKLSIHVAAPLSVKVGKKAYKRDQIRLFSHPDKLSKTGTYWSLKKQLDTLENDKKTHISHIETGIRQQQQDGEWQDLLILVTASEKDAFEAWQKKLASS